MTWSDIASGKSAAKKKASLKSGRQGIKAAPSEKVEVTCALAATSSETVLDKEIKPVIAGDELVLCHTDFDVIGPTTYSTITISFEKTGTGAEPGDLGVSVTFDDKITCKRNGVDFNSGDEVKGDASFDLHMYGDAQGACTVTATLTGTPTAECTYLGPATKDVWVEKLTLNACQYSEGLRTEGDAAPNAGTVGTTKTRELHQWRDNTFTFAKFKMHKPSDGFWTKADEVALTADGTVAAFSDAGANTALAALAKGDFDAGATKDFWVRSTVDDRLDAGVGPRGTQTVKDITKCHISCGAKGAGLSRELKRGDAVLLDTFSFDRYLDRTVQNECVREVAGNKNLKTKCAVARAAHNKYYGKESGFEVNKAELSAGGNPFEAFIDAVNGGTSAAEGARLGKDFVDTHMLREGSRLGPLMLAAVESHILGTLNGKFKKTKRTNWQEGKSLNWAGLTEKQKEINAFGFMRNFKIPGSHAEVIAANALYVGGADPAEISVATYKLQQSGKGKNARFLACKNCSGILKEFRVITEPTPP